jgi:hypothetical protein
MRFDVRHLFPWDANSPPSPSGEDCDDLQRLTGTTLEPDVVDLAAPPALRVDQLMIEHVEPKVDRLVQF